MNIRDLIPEDKRKGALSVVQQLSRAEVVKPQRMSRITKDGRNVEIWLTATALMDKTGKVYAIVTTERTRGDRAKGNVVTRKKRDHD